MLGNPNSPTSASDLSCSLMVFASPNYPTRSFMLAVGNLLLPFPPAPPRAKVNAILSALKSFRKYYFSLPSSFSFISYTRVPIGTWTKSFPPFFPSLPCIPPLQPFSAIRFLVLKCLRSVSPVLVYKTTSPPLPPQPPSGGPLLWYLSFRKVYTPLPPLPALAFNRTSSTNCLCYLLEH